MEIVRKPLCLAVVMAVLLSIMGITSFAVSYSATPTSSPLYVDSSSVSLQAYNIEGYNYFKLRDIAMVLNGTIKQFEVGYDNYANSITISTSTPYTQTGTECIISNDTGTKPAAPSASTVFMDGNEVKFSAFLIGGNNYIKLRDLAKIIDFNLSYDGATNSINIETATGYSNDTSSGGSSETVINTSIVGNWGRFYADEAGSYISGVGFEPDGKFYYFSRLIGFYSSNNGYINMYGLAYGALPGSDFAGNYKISTSGGKTILTNGTYTFVKSDSVSTDIIGTWTYAATINDVFTKFSLTFTVQDNAVYVDTSNLAGKYTCTSNTIDIIGSDGSTNSFGYELKTENGCSALTYDGNTYNYVSK